MSKFDVLESWALCNYLLVIFASAWYKFLYCNRCFDELVFLMVWKKLEILGTAEFIGSGTARLSLQQHASKSAEKKDICANYLTDTHKRQETGSNSTRHHRASETHWFGFTFVNHNSNK